MHGFEEPPQPADVVPGAQTAPAREQEAREMRDILGVNHINVLYTRMRPDLIIFGETVRSEAVELLSAMNLGKKVITTIHSNSAYDALLRLENLSRASGLPLPAIRERIGRGIDLVAHLRRSGSRRYVEEVVRVKGIKDGEYQLERLF